MAGSVTEVVEGGRVVRLYLSEPMVPGSTFARKGVTYRVAGDGEIAEPIVMAAGLAPAINIDPGVMLWVAAFAVGWYFLMRRR